MIIGAGPAGLTAALEFLKQSAIQPIVLEDSREIGGSLARSDTRATGWNNIRSIKTEQDYHEQNSCKTKMADAL